MPDPELRTRDELRALRLKVSGHSHRLRGVELIAKQGAIVIGQTRDLVAIGVRWLRVTCVVLILGSAFGVGLAIYLALR